jgi:hypothetical protein
MRLSAGSYFSVPSQNFGPVFTVHASYSACQSSANFLPYSGITLGPPTHLLDDLI